MARQRNFFGLLHLLSLLTCLAASCSHADSPLASKARHFMVDQIRHAASYEEKASRIEIDMLPSSANFDACSNPEFFLPHSLRPLLQRRLSVGVRCNGDGRQVRYLTADIRIIANYPLLAVSIERDTVISADMLDTQRGELGQLPADVLLSRDNIIGRIAVRDLTAGSLFRNQDVRVIPLVERGQDIIIESGGSGFTASRTGQALDSGTLGDSIRVRLNRSNTLTARVTGQGRARPE